MSGKRFSDKYVKYLESDEWKEKRAERLKKDQYRCVLCGAEKNLEVHHVYCDNLYHEDVSNDLITLCKECHERVHEDKDYLTNGIISAYLILQHKDKMHEFLSSMGIDNENLRYWFCEQLNASMRVIRVPMPGGEGCITIPFSEALHHEKDARIICKYFGDNYFDIKNNAKIVTKALYGEEMYITDISAIRGEAGDEE